MGRKVRRQPVPRQDQQPTHVPLIDDLYRVTISGEDMRTSTVIIRIDTVSEQSVDATITRIESEEKVQPGDRRASFDIGQQVFVWRSQLTADMKIG